MKYILILCLFGTVDVDMFSNINLFKLYRDCLLTNFICRVKRNGWSIALKRVYIHPIQKKS